MKRYLSYILILAISALSAGASAATRGEKTVGIQAGYSSRCESGMAGVFFQYRFSDHFRIAPSVDYVFRHNNTDAYALNIDTHYPIALGASRVTVYPIAGLNLSSWNIRTISDSSSDDTNTRRSRIGANVGGGVEMQLTGTLKLNVEGIYNYIDKFDGAYIKASIGYTF